MEEWPKEEGIRKDFHKKDINKERERDFIN